MTHHLFIIANLRPISDSQSLSKTLTSVSLEKKSLGSYIFAVG